MINNYNDNDPQETQEWIESIEDALEEHGYERARFLLETLIDYAQAKGARLPFNTNTPYLNTILPEQEPEYPGNKVIERKIKSAIRWNAMAMVTKANKNNSGIGGHISTYASAATLYEVAFNHFFKGLEHEEGQDLIFFQGHASPGMYSRSFLEGVFTEKNLLNFRRELEPAGGLSSYPHPYLMPDYWQFATVSMGLGPIMAIYQARFMRYMMDRGFLQRTSRKVFAYLGDGEMDEPESTGALTLASREDLDNLIFVINCNLQRLDGPVRGNSKVIQELEGAFRGAGWNVIKVIWGSEWDEIIKKDTKGAFLKRTEEVVDGEMLKYVVEGGAYFRENFFGKDPDLLKLVDHLSDEELGNMRLGGHDSQKVYAAYNEAVSHKGSPTVILARTIKGYGLGDAGEGKNITHNQKKLKEDELIYFKNRFDVPITKQEAKEASFYKFDEKSEEFKYLMKRRSSLGGSLPKRKSTARDLKTPERSSFQEMYEGTGEREISTTMAFVRLLTLLTKNKDIGKNIVPIIPDEARTFGMDPLFRQLGIYAHSGQLYEPVDSDQFLYYKEAKNGQILEEGINEAGAISSFIAAGMSYSTHGTHMIPFYIYYSMFGFQRVWDFIWAAGDMRARGFLLGGTAGRTTLNGEGLQHQDGHSLLAAAATPNIKAYDLAYAYEISTVIQVGIKEMVEENKDVIYYLTLENQNYVHPAMPKNIEKEVLKGLYKVVDNKKASVQLFGSGPLLTEVLEAAELLKKDWGVESSVWSVTSYSELRREAEEVDRWNQNHPKENIKKSFLNDSLESVYTPIVAVTDYMKLVSEQIRPFIKNTYLTLGTDGFGRSDTRNSLRKFFEIDKYYIVFSAIQGLVMDKKIEPKLLSKVMEKYDLDSEKSNPMKV
ncbi:pyruvate dehydrogenase (acetyl-transferring), homodimeric type [bacterium]|nr:pyruvate dehydrogenase (acetyl-transferring), homodimeric type [bacterium]